MDISKLKIYDYIFIVAFCVIVIFGSGVIASLGREGIGIAQNGVILRDYVLFVPLLVLNLSARLIMAKFEKFGAVFGALFALNLVMFICSFYFQFKWLFSAYYFYFLLSKELLYAPLVIFVGFLAAICKVKFR